MLELELNRDRLATVTRRTLREIARLRRNLDALQTRLVTAARLEGASWAQLGDDLGVTKQAAHRRYGASDPIARRRRARLRSTSSFEPPLE